MFFSDYLLGLRFSTELLQRRFRLIGGVDREARVVGFNSVADVRLVEGAKVVAEPVEVADSGCDFSK